MLLQLQEARLALVNKFKHFFIALLVLLVISGDLYAEVKPGAATSNHAPLVGIDTGNSVVFNGGVIGSCVSPSSSDLVVDASNNLKVTSASYKFQSSDVGHPLLVAPVLFGTNLAAGWTQGFYNIASVSNGAAILSTSPAAVSTTGGAFYFGISNDCQYFHTKNLNVMRYPFLWESLQPVLGGSFNGYYLGQIENAIRQAGILGMSVFPDAHDFGGYNGIKLGAPGGPTNSQFASMWAQLATDVYGQAGLYGYELMNEPSNMPNYMAWPNAAQAAITAIRAIDTTSLLMIDGDAFATSFGWLGDCAACGGAPIGGWGPGGNNVLRSLVDPNNNVVYVSHFYDDSDGSGTYPLLGQQNASGQTCLSGNTSYQCAQSMGNTLQPSVPISTNIGVQRLTPFVNWCNQFNLQCAMTEDGVRWDDPSWLMTLDLSISYLQNNNILFTYWVGAPWGACDGSANPTLPSTDCSYYLGAYPTNLGSSPILDTPQMAVLTKHTDAYSPPSYQIYGPQRGSVHVASSNFTVFYNGYIKNSFTVTPNDNGASGTFSPTFVTCAAGFNCSGTFTYTAPGSAVYVIGTTNTGGLTNPPSLGYATVADQFSMAGLVSSQISNALAMRKIYAPYIGNAISLRRGSDNVIKDFGFTSNALGSLVNTAAIQAWNGTGETDTLGSTTVVVQYAAQFSSDAGVSYVSSGTPLTRVTSSPAMGQYTVTTNGHYGFNASDIGNTVRILYMFPTYVVSWYDQSGNGNNAGVVQFDGPPLQLSNQPQFFLNCQNGEPCMYFNGTNYMDLASPFTFAQTQQTVLSVFSPSVPQVVPAQLPNNGAGSSILNGALLNWSFFGAYVTNFWCNTNGGSSACFGGWGNSYTNQLSGNGVFNSQTRTYSVDAQWHATGDTYIGNVSDGQRTFFDGQITDRVGSPSPVTFTGSISGSVLTISTIGGCLINPNVVLSGAGFSNVSIMNQATHTGSCTSGGLGTYNLDNLSSLTVPAEPMTATVTFYLPFGRNTAKMGYSQGSLPGSKYNGYLGELIVLNSQIGNSNSVSFQNDQDTAWGISPYSGWTPYSPTLNQNTMALNALPWLGINNYDGSSGGNVGNSTPFLAGLGENIERVVSSWSQMQPVVGQPLSTTYMSNLAANVSKLNALGVDALIDNHDGSAYAGCPINGSGCPTDAQFASYWGLVATYFLSNPKVAFDLANEPVQCCATITQWGTYVQEAITAIRNTGATQYIFVELNNGFAQCAGGGSVGAGQPGTVFLSLTDPLNKLVYECHNYWDGTWNGGQVNGFGGGGFNSSSEYAGSSGIALSDLGDITTWAVANNVKLFLGEFGLGWTQSSYFENKVALDLIAANLATNSTGGWAGWTAWGGGSGWGNGYYFYLQPQIFDANTVPKPVDRALNAFWTGHTLPCSVYISGSSGPCSTTGWPSGIVFPQ